ncbi:MAG: hypothetical protein LBI03_10965, partial [Clostridiales bacterium]|nr:hypothetical protein [Clostridiales bacterium]
MDSISKKEILNLDLEQCKRFSQICALLALPFIGVRGNFEFWERNKRQKYLGDVLSTIDYIVFTNTCAANAADYATNAAADYANVATDYADAATAAAAAADYAAAAANAAADYANVNATDYAACATAAATAAAAAAAAYATEDYATNVAIFQWDTYSKFRKYLIKLFTSIRDNMPLPEFNAHEFYGGIYDNFLKALKDVGCEYWANIYEHVYSNNFEFDEVELRLRLQAPDSVREEGAAAIAKHMLAIKEQGNKETKEARIILIG